MLKLNRKNPKKIGIHLSFKLKQQQHPWDMIAEKAKAKQLKQPVKIHEVHVKPYRKNLLSFTEEPSNQLSKILNPQQTSPEQNLKGNGQLIGEHVSAKGFYLCPFCTCWFTNKKTLKSHIKHWCGR